MAAALPNLGYGAYLMPLAAVALIILRNLRPRRLRVERLWIGPVVIVALIVLSLAQQGVPTPLMIGLDVVALVLGAALGWWRGRLTQITVDPASHELTSRTSPVGMLLILAIFVVRYGLRMLSAENATALHVSVNTIADAALVITVGIVCAQRLEVALRANRMLTEVRSGAGT